MDGVIYRTFLVMVHDGVREQLEVKDENSSSIMMRTASQELEGETAITPGFERYGDADGWIEVRSNDVVTRSYSRIEPQEPDLTPDEDGEIDLPRSERGPIHNSQEAGEDE